MRSDTPPTRGLSNERHVQGGWVWSSGPGPCWWGPGTWAVARNWRSASLAAQESLPPHGPILLRVPPGDHRPAFPDRLPDGPGSASVSGGSPVPGRGPCAITGPGRGRLLALGPGMAAEVQPAVRASLSSPAPALLSCGPRRSWAGDPGAGAGRGPLRQPTDCACSQGLVIAEPQGTLPCSQMLIWRACPRGAAPVFTEGCIDGMTRCRSRSIRWASPRTSSGTLPSSRISRSKIGVS